MLPQAQSPGGQQEECGASKVTSVIALTSYPIPLYLTGKQILQLLPDDGHAKLRDKPHPSMFTEVSVRWGEC